MVVLYHPTILWCKWPPQGNFISVFFISRYSLLRVRWNTERGGEVFRSLLGMTKDLTFRLYTMKFIFLQEWVKSSRPVIRTVVSLLCVHATRLFGRRKQHGTLSAFLGRQVSKKKFEYNEGRRTESRPIGAIMRLGSHGLNIHNTNHGILRKTRREHVRQKGTLYRSCL